MEAPNRLGSASKHQAMFKKASPMPWKEAYKTRCAQQLRKSRSKLLQKFRKMDVGEVDEDLNCSLMSNVDEAMNAEFIDMKASGQIQEFDKIIESMEQIKQELMIQEQELLMQYINNSRYEAQMANADAENYEKFNYLNEKSPVVICPICKQNNLFQHLSFIKCKCGLSINTEQDCINLNHVKVQLQIGTTIHGEKCHGQPVFSASEGFGIENLIMACHQCDYLFVVI